jgi:hypothetical protein
MVNPYKELKKNYSDDIEKRLVKDNDVTNLSRGSYIPKRKIP